MRTVAIVATTIALFMGLAPSMRANASSPLDQAVFPASNPIDTHDYLVQFHQNPKQVMNTPLAKRDQNGHVLLPESSPLGATSKDTDALLKSRDLVRAKICASSGSFCEPKSHSVFAEMDKENQITNFLWDKEYINNLLEMEQKGLQTAILPVAPWTDSFWPMYRGLIARRWLDTGFPESNTWLDNYNYYLAHPPMTVGINQMAASEKYDLLVGDFGFGLTNANWGSGKESQAEYGYVPMWQGLCHGWSPASFMTPTPKRSVVALSPNGTPITFYPSDIKALSSQAWGSSPPTVNFVGTRCKVSHPKEDDYGRVIDPGCFDVNPGTWHMAVTNQMGVKRRSMIFDATYDFQVWNYPLDAYTYHYFNPQTLAISDKLNGAVVRRTDFTLDKFKQYRSPSAKFMVGIAMDVTYVVPSGPSTAPVLASQFHTIKYVYDLELDEKGKIIGGEWYSNFHPDFIWQPPVDGRPMSAGERMLATQVSWDGAGPVPAELQSAARVSSPRQQPVWSVIETLVRKSQEAP